MKLNIIFIFLLLLIPSVLAYDIDSTVTIEAEYRVNGTLTNATSVLWLRDPVMTYVVQNKTMTPISTGVFTYDYNCTQIGKYNVNASFYDGSNNYLGSDQGSFTCGDIDNLNLLTCPTSTIGIVGLWVFVIIIIILGIAGIITRYPVLTGIAGGMFVLLAFTTWGCSNMLGYLSCFLAFAFGMIAFNQK